MQVALNGSHNDLALAFCAFFGQIGLEDLGSCLHGTRGNQYLRDKNLICLKLCSDDIHTCQKSLGQNYIGLQPLINCLLTEFSDILSLAFLKHLRDFFKHFTHL